jgi:hypothetical protein
MRLNDEEGREAELVIVEESKDVVDVVLLSFL